MSVGAISPIIEVNECNRRFSPTDCIHLAARLLRYSQNRGGYGTTASAGVDGALSFPLESTDVAT
jgi:hypothetical protein